MPELPDLQVFSQNLNKALAGKIVKKVTVVNASKLKVTEGELKKSSEKEKLTEVKRVGKELHFHFANGQVLGMHLMLNGNLFLFREDNNHNNTIIELIFDDNTGLALIDSQALATPSLNPENKNVPDALSPEVNVDFLKERLKTRSVIKKVLLDQNIIRGIGNAYADEILWEARISPLSNSNKIPLEKIEALVRSIKHVLQDAEKQIRKTHPDIISGEIRDFLKIHNPRKKQSPTGAAIEIATIGGRKTYYTNEQDFFG
jgi:formamidopyrimidine-DNA glycosylase